MNTQLGSIAVVRARKRTEGVFDVFLTIGHDDPMQIGRIERHDYPHDLDNKYSPREGWKTTYMDGYNCGIARTKGGALLDLARHAGVSEPVKDGGRVIGWVG